MQRFSFAVILSLGVLPALSTRTSAQALSTSNAAVSATTDFVQTVAYWTAEEGWHTELHLRNNMANGPLVVTPVLHDASGKEFSLAAVTIPSKTGQVIDLAAAIAQSAPELTGQYGSLDLRYTSPTMRVLYAAVMVHRMAKPIDFHIDAAASNPDLRAGDREGIWWLPTSGTRDTLVITDNVWSAAGLQGKSSGAIDKSAAMYSAFRWRYLSWP